MDVAITLLDPAQEDFPDLQWSAPRIPRQQERSDAGHDGRGQGRAAVLRRACPGQGTEDILAGGDDATRRVQVPVVAEVERSAVVVACPDRKD